MKIGIDSLVSQVLKYYKAYYSPYITELPSSPPPSPPPVSTSPPVTSPLTMSTSYSSFYSYTRTLSQGDITTIIDPFDSVPSSSSYASFPIEYSEESVSEPVSHWSWFRFLFGGHTRSASSVTPSSESTPTSLLPPSLRRLPLYLYSLRRGCLFGDCFHNGDLLQLHRLRLASATLQDSLRIILPQLTIASKEETKSLARIHSVPLCVAPPSQSSHLRQSSNKSPSHRPGGSGPVLPTPSMPVMSLHRVTPSLTDIRSANTEVVYALTSPPPIPPPPSSPPPIPPPFSSSPPPVSSPLSKQLSIHQESHSDYKYTGFVAEGEKDVPYYLESRLVGQLDPNGLPEFRVLPPETLALMSDCVVVLDTEREIFVWVGAERVGMENDPVYNGCMSLALSLTQKRDPPSAIRVVFEYSSKARFVLCNLIPSHKDPMDVVVKSLPILQHLSPQLLRNHIAKFLHTDDMSFREYMAKIYHFRSSVCYTKRQGEKSRQHDKQNVDKDKKIDEGS